MSTLSEIERMPHAARRCFIQAGDSAVGSKPSTVSATNSGQASDSSTTGWPPWLGAGVAWAMTSR